MFIYLLMHAFGVIVFLIWFMYAAIDGSNFGSQPSCNHLVYFVLFFVNIRATATWFRVVMIIFFAVAIPVLLLLLGFLIIAPARWMQACTDRLQKLYDRNPRLVLVRYVVGIP